MTSPIARIAVPSPLYRCFDYLVPQSMSARSLLPGIRIKIPFGSREYVGILLEVVSESPVDPAKLREIIEILDEEPVLPPKLLALCQWASRYYHHPVGEVVVGTLPKLIRQGLALAFSPSDTVSHEHASTHTLNLNSDQQQAVEAITQAQGFSCFLLEGVTGSGKTEVYLRAIEACVSRHQQALVLIPEIGLTPQNLERFLQRFSQVKVYHSGLTDKERFQTWMSAQRGEAQVIIGTRSAVFLPFKHLGLIVLDEEHDLSFKQHSGFRYSARDVGVYRAQLESCAVVLGSATPSLESLYNVERKRYQKLQLKQRAGVALAPRVQLVNVCHQPLKAGLSPVVLDAMQKHLARQGQILLFLNRRGYAPALLCHDCGWISSCDRCDAQLTLHQQPKRLRCHHCEATRAVPKTCAECHSAELIQVGQGTEQIEQTITELFPQRSVVRIDRDSTRAKGSMKLLLDAVHTQEANILVGTQMLAKGHHFSALTMVVIVDADGGLFSSDFRALERMGQLMVQVMGRAGRVEQMGEVFIQSHHPEHPLLQCLLNEGYAVFAQKLLQERAEAGLPPYAHTALLRAESTRQSHPFDFLETAKQSFKRSTSVQALGPIPASMERKAGRFRAQLLLQSPQRAGLQAELKQLVQRLSQTKLSHPVRWSIDVDPQEW